MSCSRPASKLTGGEHFPVRIHYSTANDLLWIVATQTENARNPLKDVGTASIFDIFNQQAFLAAECCLNEIHTLCELLLTDEGHDVSDAETI